MKKCMWHNPKGFKDPFHPDHVYKIKRALYGLKQAPRSWYERLTKYVLRREYTRGGADRILFIRGNQGEIIVVQIYEDEIVFGFMSQGMVE